MKAGVPPELPCNVDARADMQTVHETSMQAVPAEDSS